VTRGQLPQRAGSLGLTAVGLPPRYPYNNTDSVKRNSLLVKHQLCGWLLPVSSGVGKEKVMSNMT